MARGEGRRRLEKGMGVVARVLTCICMALVAFSAVTQAILEGRVSVLEKRPHVQGLRCIFQCDERHMITK